VDRVTFEERLAERSAKENTADGDGFGSA
jgi:hypothetical protein